MEVEFSKWGNSIALRVPAKVARDTGLVPGKRAKLSVKNGVLTIAPSKKISRKERLRRIIASLEATGPMEEVSSGHTQGKEIFEW